MISRLLYYYRPITGRISEDLTTFSFNPQLPQDWKDWIYYYEPQIYYYLQQFASVTRPKADDKKLVIVFQLNTDYTAALRIQSSKITAERSELALPITITRFPQSVAEIKDYFYGACNFYLFTMETLRWQCSIQTAWDTGVETRSLLIIAALTKPNFEPRTWSPNKSLTCRTSAGYSKKRRAYFPDVEVFCRYIRLRLRRLQSWMYRDAF